MNRRPWRAGLLGLTLTMMLCGLAQVGRAAENPLLTQGKSLLASDDPLQQARGATMLGFCADDGAIALLRPVFAKNDYSSVCGAAAVALGQLHDPTILPELLTDAQHLDSGIQPFAITGTGRRWRCQGRAGAHRPVAR